MIKTSKWREAIWVCQNCGKVFRSWEGVPEDRWGDPGYLAGYAPKHNDPEYSGWGCTGQFMEAMPEWDFDDIENKIEVRPDGEYIIPEAMEQRRTKIRKELSELPSRKKMLKEPYEEFKELE